LSNSTRNIALGNGSTTLPSTSTTSLLGTGWHYLLICISPVKAGLATPGLTASQSGYNPQSIQGGTDIRVFNPCAAALPPGQIASNVRVADQMTNVFALWCINLALVPVDKIDKPIPRDADHQVSVPLIAPGDRRHQLPRSDLSGRACVHSLSNTGGQHNRTVLSNGHRVLKVGRE